MLADKLSAISAGISVVITADVSGKDESIGDITRHDWEDAMASLDGLASIMTDSDIRSDIASATGAGDKELFGKEGEELFACISLFVVYPLTRLKLTLIRSRPPRPKCRRITVKRENSGSFSMVLLTGSPPVPFQVNEP